MAEVKDGGRFYIVYFVYILGKASLSDFGSGKKTISEQ